MTREQLGVLRDARDKLCRACNAVECETCYVPRLIEKCEKEVTETAPVVHARWVTDEKGKTYCSRCRVIDDYASVHNYCPFCGAQMDLKESES